MPDKTLKTALLSNALFSTLSGGTMLFFSSSVANLIGVGATLLYQIIGVGLLGFAGYVAWVATRDSINAYKALEIILMDFLWVLGTMLLIPFIWPSLTGIGLLALIGVATIVGVFGFYQLKGIGQMYTVPGKPSTHRLCVAVDTLESADKIWSIIADLSTIKDYSPNLSQVILRENAAPGVDSVRQCTDVKGKTWAEHCVRYDQEARILDMVFLADEPGFPYPFQTMQGGWEVAPNKNGSTVHIWFEVTPKYRWAHSIILALTTRDLARSFGDTVARMAAAARGETVPIKATPPQHGISYKLIPC
ncbi:MAG: SRPBCC family protein [Chloroflexota bacterium]